VARAASASISSTEQPDSVTQMVGLIIQPRDRKILFNHIVSENPTSEEMDCIKIEQIQHLSDSLSGVLINPL
jgi:hypothetical protein